MTPTPDLTTQRFNAWGSKLAGSGTVPTFGYTGREPDSTGLMYYRARYYDPGIGRFASRDPIGLLGGVNRYEYVDSSPIDYADPTGECPMCAAGAAIGALTGLGAAIATGNTSATDLFSAVVGGAVGGGLAPLCPSCAGAAAAAASNATSQLLSGDDFDASSLALNTILGALVGKASDSLLPGIMKSLLPSINQRGKLGEWLSELGLKLTRTGIEKVNPLNGVGRSRFDFLLENGKFIESKFGTSELSDIQKLAQKLVDLDVHYWTYERVSAIFGSGIASALGLRPSDPTGGGATVGFDMPQ
jgi:RHS repeat-associated protein